MGFRLVLSLKAPRDYVRFKDWDKFLYLVPSLGRKIWMASMDLSTTATVLKELML